MECLMDNQKEISLYINIPYCNSKCHFCIYVAHIKTKDLIKQQNLHADYVEALKKQIRTHGHDFRAKGYRIHSIFFGGGTPTSLSTDQLVDVLTTLRESMDLSPNYVDTTLETTPENVIGHDFKKLYAAGFDRISMGVQSMIDSRLKRLGRCHNNAHVKSALEIFKEAGIKNVNIDLMIGLPDETNDEIISNIGQALSLNVNHCTVYLYMPAEGTVFKKKLQKFYSPEELYSKYSLVKELMENNGYNEYQWQYFSKDKTRCICDTIYFGLSTEWFAFGSTGNSLLNRMVIKGPAHHEDFIKNPLRPGQIFSPKNAPEYLELHYNLAISSEAGLDTNFWYDRLGISLQDTLKKCVNINASHNYLISKGWLKENNGRWQFINNHVKAEYSCMRIAINYDQNALHEFNSKYYQ